MEENDHHIDEATPLLEDNQRSSIINDECPYPEVAANVSNQDDSTTPCLTFRSCILGLLFTCILAFVNQVFTYRTMPIFLNMIVAQLLSYPIGKAMASVLPHRTFRLFGDHWQFSFNPGPFSVKEHCIISIMANTASVGLENIYSSYQIINWYNLGYFNGRSSPNYSTNLLQTFN